MLLHMYHQKPTVYFHLSMDSKALANDEKICQVRFACLLCDI